MEEERSEITSDKRSFPRSCDYCPKIFYYQSSLVKHERIHTKEKPYICEFEGCGQTFSQMSNLLRHKKGHSGVKPYECKKCHKRCTSLSNLTQHMGVHQQKRKRYKYSCFIGDCNTSYLYTCTLKKHLKRCHKQELDRIQEEFAHSNFMQTYRLLQREENAAKFDFVRIKNDDDSSFSDGNIEDNILTHGDVKIRRKRKNSAKSRFVPDRCINITINNTRKRKGKKSRIRLRSDRNMSRTRNSRTLSQAGINSPPLLEKSSFSIIIPGQLFKFDTAENSDINNKNLFAQSFGSIYKIIKETQVNTINSNSTNFITELTSFFCKFLKLRYSLTNNSGKIIKLLKFENEYPNDELGSFEGIIQLLAEELLDKSSMVSSMINDLLAFNFLRGGGRINNNNNNNNNNNTYTNHPPLRQDLNVNNSFNVNSLNFSDINSTLNQRIPNTTPYTMSNNINPADYSLLQILLALTGQK